ncbi:MAG: hypothetical protein IPK58_23720 [Acidobacteria bacterium]|nr:hypothetical protein [Acidobacteriota bacterium]
MNPRRSPTPTASLTVEPEKLSPTDVTDYWTQITAVAAILVASILAGYLAKQILERVRYGKNALSNLRGLKKAISAKNELTQRWLKRRRSANIHAIGVGKIDGANDYCIQVFVEDANGEMLEDPPTRLLPAEFRELPIVIYEMPRADFLNANEIDHARGGHDVLTGGISAANANLTGEFGTIGYFFRPNLFSRAKQAFLKNDVYLLSSAHVFADLSRAEKDDSDLIIQPSPGDSSSGRPVAELVDVSPIEFGGDVENPNFVDAAIARIDRRQAYSAEIPRIGAIRGFLRKESVTLRSDCQKFGRTTGYTRGRVFSIHLSIWVKYSARRTDALFKDQFLIVPTDRSSFVKGGDSGSLVVDDQNRAARTHLRRRPRKELAAIFRRRRSRRPRKHHYQPNPEDRILRRRQFDQRRDEGVWDQAGSITRRRYISLPNLHTSSKVVGSPSPRSSGRPTRAFDVYLLSHKGEKPMKNQTILNIWAFALLVISTAEISYGQAEYSNWLFEQGSKSSGTVLC